MALIEFEYSKNAVNKAGVALIGDDNTKHGEAKTILDN
jgi:hypothetical protein